MRNSLVPTKLYKDVAPVRAFRSLKVRDTEIVTQAVNAFGGNWSVQTCDDYDGYAFMLIEPLVSRGERLPEYLVYGKTGEIELAVVNGDDCQTVGRFADIHDLTAEITLRLLCGAHRSKSHQRQTTEAG